MFSWQSLALSSCLSHLPFLQDRQPHREGKRSEEMHGLKAHANKIACSSPYPFGDCLKFRVLQMVCLGSLGMH